MSAFSAAPPSPPFRPHALLFRAQRSCKEFQWQVAPLPYISLIPLFMLRHRNFLHLSTSKGRRISGMPGFNSINKRSGQKLSYFPGGYGRSCSVCDALPKEKGFQKGMVVCSSLMSIQFSNSVLRLEKLSASVIVHNAWKFLVMVGKVRFVGILVLFWVCVSATARGERILGHSGKLPLACISTLLTENIDGRPTKTDVVQSVVQSKEIDSEVENNYLVGKREGNKKQPDITSLEHLEADEANLVFQNAPHGEPESRKDDSFKPDESFSFKKADLGLISTAESAEREGIKEKYEEDARKSSFKDNAQTRPPEGNLMGVDGQKDEELELAYEEWKAKPYILTVPLRIVALRASVPYVWLKEFMQSQGKRIKLSMEFRESLRDMITDLAISVENRRLTRHSIMAADLVTVGDSWLGSAINGGLIEPIGSADDLDLFRQLGPRWKNFLRRNKDGQLDPNGMFWGVPYRWGCTVIAYRKDKFSEANLSAIKDWLDIWRPELAAKVSMVDSPREVVGAILKSLGASYNCKDFNEDVQGGREAVKNQFLNLLKQVRLFDSTNYLKALGTGDVWVAVGWSNDVIPFARRSSNIAFVVPTSGTSIWADLWAVPAATCLKSDKVGSRIRGPSPLICQWLDFCLQPARTTSFKAGLMAGDSPLSLAEENSSCKNSIEGPNVAQMNGEVETKWNSFESQGASDNMEEFMSQATIKRSEFVEPLSKQAMHDYEWLFSDVPLVDGWPNDLWELLKGAFQVSWTKVAGVRF